MKLNRFGAYQWHAFYSSSKEEQGIAITSDRQGNIYVAGYGASWQGPGNATMHAYTGSSNFFVFKLQANDENDTNSRLPLRILKSM